MNRRGFMAAILATATAPAIVKAGSIMRINPQIIAPQRTIFHKKAKWVSLVPEADPNGSTVFCLVEEIKPTYFIYGQTYRLRNPYTRFVNPSGTDLVHLDVVNYKPLVDPSIRVAHSILK